MARKSCLTAYKTELRVVAPMLINLGMFNSEGGGYSGLLAKYKGSLDEYDSLCTFVMMS